MVLKNNIENLKQQDFYSLLLFCLYKMSNVPEYSSLSEMAYVLDRESLLNLCEFFGGQTIKVPTIDEVESLVYSLLLYQYVKIDKMNYDDAIELIGHESCELRQVKSKYQSLCKIMENYTFKCRSDINGNQQ